MVRGARLLLLAMMALGATLVPAVAADAGCDAVKEVLDWTAEALVDIRDGKRANGWYIAAAIEFAADKTAEAGWPENTAGVLDELAMLAVGIEDRFGKADPGDGEGMLGYADALAKVLTERCGAEGVPVFVRPGVGDRRACAQVIETLEALGKAMPSVRGDAAPMWLLPVTTNGRKAVGEAAYSQWSAASIAALNYIQTGAVLMSRGEAPTEEKAALRMLELAAIVAAEAQAICKDNDIPMLATAGQ